MWSLSSQDTKGEKNASCDKASLVQKRDKLKIGDSIQSFVNEGSHYNDRDLVIMSTLCLSEDDSEVEDEHKEEKKSETITVSKVNEDADSSVCTRKSDDLDYSSALPSLVRELDGRPRKKLLILDINGLLADVVSPLPKGYRADKIIERRAIFKRPYYLDFMEFCFQTFKVGIWSSRKTERVEKIVDYLIGDMKQKLLFCWVTDRSPCEIRLGPCHATACRRQSYNSDLANIIDTSYCTPSKFKTLENRHKPLVFKDLRKVWQNHDSGVSWMEHKYNESNTLLVDDSPYKALLNPPHTAIFPFSFTYHKKHDNLLGPGGEIRVYLEHVALAENVQNYVQQHPFGQSAITESSPDWIFYLKAINSVASCSGGRTRN